MVFDVEYIVADLRPLRGKNNCLINFLVPLHKKNETIRKRYFKYQINPYFKRIGSLNTSETSTKTIFEARNAVKFPLFNHTKIRSTGDFDTEIKLKKKIRRYFSTESFGAVNRLRIGFEFDLRLNNDTDKNAISKLLSCIFNINIVDSKNSTNNLKHLDNWLSDIVHKSVYKHTWLEKRIKFFQANKSKKLVKPVGVIATIEFSKEEIFKLPIGTKEIVDNELFQIFSYVFDLNFNKFHFDEFHFNKEEDEKRKETTVEIYFIKKKHPHETSSHKIKSDLFLVKSNYLCLEFIIDKINLSTKVQRDYIAKTEGIKGLLKKDFKNNNSLFLTSPQVLGNQENIDKIKKRIMELRKIDDFINLPKNNN